MAYWKDQLNAIKKRMTDVERKGSLIHEPEEQRPAETPELRRSTSVAKKASLISAAVPSKKTSSVQPSRPEASATIRTGSIRLNTQAPQVREINIGFDLGTAYTKVAYRILGPEIVGFVQLSNGGPEHEKTMIPSVVWVDKSQRLYIATDSIPEGSEPIRFFKMHLAGSGIGPCAGNGLCTKTPLYKLVTAYFLYRVLDKAKAIIKSEHSSLIGSSRISWSGNLGIPVGYIESKLDSSFIEVWRAGAFISSKASVDTNPMLNEFDALYQRALAESDNESVNFHLTTELEASISSLTSDIATPDGLYGLFDIGGGTLDGAVFSFRRENGSPRINILTALVAPIGFDVAVDSLAKSITREDIQYALKSGGSMLRLRSQDIQKSIHVHVSSVVVIARRKSNIRWAEQMKAFPIFLCGGGSHATWLKDTIIGTWQSHQHGNCGIPQYQPQSLGVPEEFDHRREYIKDWDRHLVAYGLSFPKGSLQEVVGFPKNNPIMEYEQYNHDRILTRECMRSMVNCYR